MGSFKIRIFLKKLFDSKFQINSKDQSNNNNYKVEERKNIPKKYKIKLVTSYDENFSEIGDKTSKTLKNYAEKFDYTFEKIDQMNLERPYAWNKIQILLNEMKNSNYDYILWIDADAYFNRYDIDIAEEIEKDKNIYLVKHYCEVHKGSYYDNTKLVILRINTGVLMMKCCKDNEEFLEKVWNKEEYINHDWWEQAAIMDIFGFKSELNGNLNDNKGKSSYSKNLKFISNQWNSIPSNYDLSMEKQNQCIIHLAGMTIKNRIEYLKNKLK